MLIASSGWIAPEDYKIYCYHGKAKYIMVCVGREKEGHPKFFYFDREWKLMYFNPDSVKNKNINIEKPKSLDKMLDYAEKLSAPFPFVRADFYCSGEKIIFGELTFTPSGGMDTDNFHEADLLMGEFLHIKN